MTSAAPARETEKPAVRPILLSEHPDRPTHRVYVKGQVVTTLRFKKAVDPDKTKMIGWEGRLEPLAVVRNKVLLEPIHDLDSDEAIPLAVTLVDGTEVAFLLRPTGHETWSWTDQQVNVFEDPKSFPAMHGALMRALEENDSLTEENARYRKEENSEDHALAALLTSGALAQTPFKLARYEDGQDDGIDIRATLYKGKGKAAVVFRVRNLSSKQPWSMKSARILTVASGRERAVAARSSLATIAPGESGVIAIVADRSAFMEDGKPTSVFLELYRHDGLRQVLVQLDPDLVAQ
ncbi:DUF2381 family protein [Melittangium boletus]|uniref:DUF2381 family protein n=1 Tax=Melittangium boletus DSM 14713 TaxID=1294270 RepID=A0A250IHU5_9BACT|nr:DUF2381 family protein [Melittangium boletus]ATB31394.1 hypothetical protein MEBOL_004856 [Melittangium boletus DSM 14713]